MNEEKRSFDKAIEEWLETRPPPIRDLAKKFPIGSIFWVGGHKFYHVGYAEVPEDPDHPRLILSSIDPLEDYDYSNLVRFSVPGGLMTAKTGYPGEFLLNTAAMCTHHRAQFERPVQ
jgi:hypothetical protein